MQHEPTRKTAGGRQFGAAIWCVGQNVTKRTAHVHLSDDGVILYEPSHCDSRISQNFVEFN